MSFWDNLPTPPPDVVFRMDAQAKAAADPKINLVIGAYRDSDGKPYVLDAVRKAERILSHDKTINKEYLPIDGLAGFREASLKFLYGALTPTIRDRIASVQTLSGTGACRIAAEFLAHTLSSKTTDVYLSNPTWANHFPIFREAGFKTTTYRYYCPRTHGVDFMGMCEDLLLARNRSIIVLHLCAHNPTGCDPTHEQWRRIAEIVEEKEHIVLFDSAYQGYASGDPDKDAFAARLFLEMGLEFLVAQSYAKNMGLYSERVGCLSAVAHNPIAAKAVQGTMKGVIRPMYSNPPAHGARIAHLILTDPVIREEWRLELKGMSDRIRRMRSLVRDRLVELGTRGTWNHITDQIGMFCYLGIGKVLCQKLIKRRVFLMMSGRINVAGLTTKTARDLADHIHAVVEAQHAITTAAESKL